MDSFEIILQAKFSGTLSLSTVQWLKLKEPVFEASWIYLIGGTTDNSNFDISD